MLKRGTPNVKTKGRTSIDKWQTRTPQRPTPQCGCSHGSAAQFATKTNLGQKDKEEERPGSLKANHNALPKSIPTLSGTLSFPRFLRPAKASKC
ncbi:hypothetical protein JHK84_043445 [Glycine max]|nr:hypothetical protein JHK87_043154 [Glycine soja]KAG4950023.1 hypothetical protein JHK86_043262 [Glycine max]KAG4957518.1 hypothetical protein JHK85_043898 [Glycine max]KAG5117332.1 hypothetical protein JHK84_043445 [Glycine max]